MIDPGTDFLRLVQLINRLGDAGGGRPLYRPLMGEYGNVIPEGAVRNVARAAQRMGQAVHGITDAPIPPPDKWMLRPMTAIDRAAERGNAALEPALWIAQMMLYQHPEMMGQGPRGVT